LSTPSSPNGVKNNKKGDSWENFKASQKSWLANKVKEQVWKKRNVIGNLAWQATSAAGTRAAKNILKRRTRKNRNSRKNRKDRTTRNRKD
jgi:hypothetical protein